VQLEHVNQARVQGKLQKVNTRMQTCSKHLEKTRQAKIDF